MLAPKQTYLISKTFVELLQSDAAFSNASKGLKQTLTILALKLLEMIKVLCTL